MKLHKDYRPCYADNVLYTMSGYTIVKGVQIYTTTDLLKGSGITAKNFIDYLVSCGHMERLEGSTFKFKDHSMDEYLVIRGKANGYSFCKWTEEGKEFVNDALKVYKYNL